MNRKPDQHRKTTINSIPLLFRKLVRSISDLFQPEEVEVTFKVDGKNTTYTYTKVPQKQVA